MILLAHSNFLARDPKQLARMKPYSPLSTLIGAALLRRPGPRNFLDRIMLRLPVAGGLVRQSIVSRISLTLATLLWVWQYRTTRQRTGIYPVDKFGGYTTEMAGPSTWFFLIFTAIITAFAVVLILGHIVWGQKF